MKLPIKEITLLGVYSIIFIFIIGAVFYFNFSGKSGMLSAVGEVYEANTEQQPVSQNGDRIDIVTAAAAPEIRYVNRTFRAGEEFPVRELFRVKTAGAADFVSAENEDGFSLSVQDIRDEAGIPEENRTSVPVRLSDRHGWLRKGRGAGNGRKYVQYGGGGNRLGAGTGREY